MALRALESLDEPGIWPPIDADINTYNLEAFCSICVHPYSSAAIPLAAAGNVGAGAIGVQEVLEPEPAPAQPLENQSNWIPSFLG